jgi:hypothetical protein
MFSVSFAESDLLSKKTFPSTNIYSLHREENNDFLIDYLREFNNSAEKCYVYSSGKEVPANTKLKIEDMIKNKDYLSLKKYLNENRISIGYTKRIVKQNNPLRAIPSENGSYTKYFYEIASGKVGGKTTYITKEWTTVLTGRFTIDSKGNILYTSGATIHADTNFGAAFAPYMEDVYASASYRKPNTLICRGGYKLKSTIVIPIKDFGINIVMDFGSFYRSFEQNV